MYTNGAYGTRYQQDWQPKSAEQLAGEFYASVTTVAIAAIVGLGALVFLPLDFAVAVLLVDGIIMGLFLIIINGDEGPCHQQSHYNHYHQYDYYKPKSHRHQQYSHNTYNHYGPSAGKRSSHTGCAGTPKASFSFTGEDRGAPPGWRR